MRVSSWLLVGAVLNVIAPVLSRVPGSEGPAWILWGMSLLLIGIGLIMAGLRPWLTTYAVVPGIMYCVHAAALAFSLAGVDIAAYAYQVLVLPKHLTVAILAVVAHKDIAPHRRFILLGATLIATLKPVLRESGLLPQTPAAASWLDVSINLLVAVALVIVAAGLRRHEDELATAELATVGAMLSDFDRSQERPRKAREESAGS